MRILKIEIVFMTQTVLCLKTSPVIEKTVHVASSAYALNHATSVVWCVNDLEEVNSFLRNFHGCVFLPSMQNGSKKGVCKFDKRFSYQQTVFFAKDIEEFGNFMSVLKLNMIVPIHLILVLTNTATDADVSFVTKTALENDLANIIVVSARDTKNVELSTYFPYVKGICGNHAPVTINPEDTKWFPKKFSSFQGCSIKVAVHSLTPYSKLTIENDTLKSISGLDVCVFKLLMEKLNASIDIVSWRDHGSVAPLVNGTIAGSFGELVNKRAEILAPAVIINYLRYPVAQISPVFETVDVYWFGPHRREINQSLRILQPLMNYLTPAIITSFILFIIVTKMVMRFGLHMVHFKYSVMFQSFIIFLGQEVQFESKSWLVNSLFIMWIWFCMIVRIVYQGELVDGLQKAILEKPLRELEDAVKAVEGYGGNEAFREFYKGTSYFQEYTVSKTGNGSSRLENISAGKRFLLATNKLVAFEVDYNLQMLKEPITHAPACFFMRPGWPAAEEIGNVIQRLAEAGFVQKVLRDHDNEQMKKKIQRPSQETYPLNMDTVIGCFYGLGVAYLICVLALIAEIVYYKITHKPKGE